MPGAIFRALRHYAMALAGRTSDKAATGPRGFAGRAEILAKPGRDPR